MTKCIFKPNSLSNSWHQTTLNCFKTLSYITKKHKIAKFTFDVRNLFFSFYGSSSQLPAKKLSHVDLKYILYEVGDLILRCYYLALN